MSILNLFKKREKNPKNELQEMIGDYELPSFPAVVMNVLSLLRDPESSIAEIVTNLQIDPGIQVKVFRTVNSAAFGLAKKVSNLQHAVSLLGRSRLESILLSLAVTDTLPTPQSESMDMNLFWLTAARRAGLARSLAMQLHSATQTESFTAALLLDMAIPVLASVKKEEYTSLFEEWRQNPEQSLVEMEQEKFSFDHAVVGGLMAESWALPEYIVTAVTGHHALAEGSAIEPAIRLVSNLRYEEEDAGNSVIDACVQEYEMHEEKVQTMVENALTDAASISRMFC